MCVSRLHRVVTVHDDERVGVVDLEGREFVASLLVLDGDVPCVGDWLVVHSGYALERVDAAEAESIVHDIAAAHPLASEGEQCRTTTP